MQTARPLPRLRCVIWDERTTRIVSGTRLPRRGDPGEAYLCPSWMPDAGRATGKNKKADSSLASTSKAQRGRSMAIQEPLDAAVRGDPQRYTLFAPGR